jgi:hypothetical protein
MSLTKISLARNNLIFPARESMVSEEGYRAGRICTILKGGWFMECRYRL